MAAVKNHLRSGPGLRYPALALTLLFLLSALGCAGAPSRTSRSLSSREAHKLIANRAWSTPSDLKNTTATDPLRLEGHGDKLARDRDWAAALFQYNRALSLNNGKDNSRLRLKIARSYLRSGQWLQAETAFSILAKEQPDNPAVWQGLGMSFLARNEKMEAQKALTKTLKLRPEAWVALQGLGILHNWQGEPGKAIPFFVKAARVKPEIPSIHNNLGISHLMAGQFDKAIDCFKRALELNPDYKLAANNLGLAYANQDRLDEAMNIFERSLGVAKAQNNLGVILAWRGDKRAAALKFKEAMRTSPRFYQLANHHLSQVNR